MAIGKHLFMCQESKTAFLNPATHYCIQANHSKSSNHCQKVAVCGVLTDILPLWCFLFVCFSENKRAVDLKSRQTLFNTQVHVN